MVWVDYQNNQGRESLNISISYIEYDWDSDFREGGCDLWKSEKTYSGRKQD